MSGKFYAYYILEENTQGIINSWEECSGLVKGKSARYKGFKSLSEAEEWLKNGANYEIKKTTKKAVEELDREAVYFDAGTGRGMGVEVRVTNYKGEPLLKDIMPLKKISKHGNYFVKEGRTNNFGELVGIYLALLYSAANDIKKIFGDSKLVIDYWSLGRYNKELDQDTKDLILKVKKMRKVFEENNGKVLYISGDENPADLGFHK